MLHELTRKTRRSACRRLCGSRGILWRPRKSKKTFGITHTDSLEGDLRLRAGNAHVVSGTAGVGPIRWSRRILDQKREAQARAHFGVKVLDALGRLDDPALRVLGHLPAYHPS